MAQTTKKKNTSAPKWTTRQAAPTPPTPSPVPRTAGGLVCLLLALCVAVSYFDAQAVLLNHLRSVLTGLFGYGYWLWAPLLLAGGLFLLLHRERKAAGRVVCALLTPVLGGSLLHLLLAKPQILCPPPLCGRRARRSPAAALSAAAWRSWARPI